MRRHLINAGFGAMDYVSYPVGMLLVAPVILRKLGSAEYGLWMIATAVISAGGILASGFCDACIQRVASLRGTGEFDRMPSAVRSMMGINFVLGVLFAASVWVAAPFAARYVSAAQLISPVECLVVFRIASVAVVVRALESVGVGVQRAFEQYRGTVQISVATRLLTLLTAALIALAGFRMIAILLATTAFLALGTIAQFAQASRVLGGHSLWPEFDRGETGLLLNRGFFAWVQAAGGVVFAQLDRIVLGIVLGAAAVTPYSLCVQFAHPIFGFTASALNFTFPYLSGRASEPRSDALRSAVLKAFACNLVLVACGAGMLLVIGDRLIGIWAGADVAREAARILPAIVIAAALMGLSVTGTYALQALGQFRTVALIGVVGRSAMLLLMFELLRRYGVAGLAFSRLFYGALALLVYVPLLQNLTRRGNESRRTPPLAIALEAQEGSKP